MSSQTGLGQQSGKEIDIRPLKQDEDLPSTSATESTFSASTGSELQDMHDVAQVLWAAK